MFDKYRDFFIRIGDYYSLIELEIAGFEFISETDKFFLYRFNAELYFLKKETIRMEGIKKHQLYHIG